MSLQVIVDYQRVTSEIIQQPRRLLPKNLHMAINVLNLWDMAASSSAVTNGRGSEAKRKLGAIYLAVVFGGGELEDTQNSGFWRLA
jgi:hypothetical protein